MSANTQTPTTVTALLAALDAPDNGAAAPSWSDGEWTSGYSDGYAAATERVREFVAAHPEQCTGTPIAPTPSVAAIVDALEGIEVWVGFRDDAGDDDGHYGTLDRDERQKIAQVLLAALSATS